MSDVVFVDSNILIRAVERLRELWDLGTGRLSVQVLQEFYVNVTRKLAAPVARSTRASHVYLQ
jgi:predicted nucleic acid-binding protein